MKAKDDIHTVAVTSSESSDMAVIPRVDFLSEEAGDTKKDTKKDARPLEEGANQKTNGSSCCRSPRQLEEQQRRRTSHESMKVKTAQGKTVMKEQRN